VQFRHALAVSVIFHLAVFSLAVLLAAQQGRGDSEYIAVDLIQPSGGGRQALRIPRPPVAASGEEPLPHQETEQDRPAEDVMGLVKKIPESSPAAPSQAQSGFLSSSNIPGSPSAGTGYLPFHRLSRIPSFKVQTQPVYPPSERTAGAEARVIVEVYINENGTVDNVMLIKSGGRLFDQAVIKAARDSSFEPGYRDDKPVPVRVQIPYSFKLR